MSEAPIQSTEGLELIDLLRVVWKWRYLVLAGTLLCIGTAGLTGLLTPPTFRIDMVIRPGVLGFDAEGQVIYVDNPKNIRTLIRVGAVDSVARDCSDMSHSADLAKSRNLLVKLYKDSNILKISCETIDVPQGLHLLSSLGEFLKKMYGGRLQDIKNKYETQIQLKQIELSQCEDEISELENRLLGYQGRIKQLRADLEFVEKNRDTLIHQRDRLPSDKENEEEVIARIIYDSAIWQNSAMKRDYQLAIDRNIQALNSEHNSLGNLSKRARLLREDVRRLESKKERIQGVEIIQPPTKSEKPVKPRIALNVVLATILGLSASLFLAFLLEYLRISRRKSLDHVGTTSSGTTL